MGCRLCGYRVLPSDMTIVLAGIFFCLSWQGISHAAEIGSLLPNNGDQAGMADVNSFGALSSGELIVAGRIHLASGQVLVRRQEGEIRFIQKGDSIYVGDTIISDDEAVVQIRMEDGGLLALRPGSELKIESFKFSGKEDGTERSFFNLNQGGFRAVTGLIGRNNKQNYKITTPTAVIGINGTDHELFYLANDMPGATAGTYSKVNDGAIIMGTVMGTLKIESNQMGYSADMNLIPQLLPINSALFNDSSMDVTANNFFSGGGVSGENSEEAPESELTTDEISSSESGKDIEAPKEAGIEELGGASGATFVPAPITWGGNLSEYYRKQTPGRGQSSLQHVQAANLRAATYIWQPWLAQLIGGIGIINVKTELGTRGTDSTSLTGRGGLYLVPYSRFPFTASAYVNDSRIPTSSYTPSPDFIGSSTGYALRQTYRPKSKSSSSEASYNRDSSTRQLLNATESTKLNSRLHLRHDYHLPGSPSLYGVGYDHKTANAGITGSEETSSFQGRYSTKFNKQFLELSTLLSNSEDVAQSNINFNNVFMRHTYRPDRLLSVNNSASSNRSTTLNVSQNSSVRNFQADSTTSWQPDEELPLYVFGSVRLYDSSYESLNVTSVSQSQSLALSASYSASKNLRYALHETLTRVRISNQSSTTTLTGGRANYTADDTKVWKGARRWNANGGLDYQTNTSANSSLTVFAGASQGYKFPYVLERGIMDFNFNQALTLRDSGNFGQINTLAHNAGVVLKPQPGETLSSSISITLADLVNFGDAPSHFQTSTLGGHLLYKSSVYSNIGANAAIGWATNSQGQSSTRAKINFRYINSRAFNVKALRYTFIYDQNKLHHDDSLVRDNDRNGYMIDQKLEYEIGRLFLRLNATLTEYGQSKNSLIVFQLGRNFGNS